MASERWVQHVSGQGEKWKLAECAQGSEAWSIEGKDWLRVPKSEYKLCDPPEVWRDVTAECVTCNSLGPEQGSVLEDKQYVIARIERGYRLEKVQVDIMDNGACMVKNGWAFIVEKREVRNG